MLTPGAVRAHPEVMQEGRSFSYVGTECAEAVGLVPIDGAVAAAAVAPYKPKLLPGGKAVLGVAIARCQSISVDGAPAAAGGFSDVGLDIELPPEAGPGPHIYQLWQTTDHGELDRSMRHLGMAGGLVGITWSSPLPGTARAQVEWGEGDYEVTTPHLPGMPSTNGANVWWHRGEKGVIRVTNHGPTYDAPIPVLVTVNAAPGSPLAQLMGAMQVVVPGGVVLLHEHHSTLELLNPDSGGPPPGQV